MKVWETELTGISHKAEMITKIMKSLPSLHMMTEEEKCIIFKRMTMKNLFLASC